MTVLLSDLIFSEGKSVTIYTDDWWSDELDGISRRATVLCRSCGKTQMPLLNKTLKYLGASFPWVGVDYQEYCAHYEFRCSKCKTLHHLKIRD